MKENEKPTKRKTKCMAKGEKAQETMSESADEKTQRETKANSYPMGACYDQQTTFFEQQN